MFSLFTRRITQDQAAEALAACLVVTAAHCAEDYLNNKDNTHLRNVIVTPSIEDQTVLEFLVVETYCAKSYIAGQYYNNVDLSHFFKQVEAAACRQYMKAQRDSGFTVESLSNIWREALETYSGRGFSGSNRKDSLLGQFGSRVAAIFGDGPYSFAATMASLSLGAALAARRDSRIRDKILSHVDWNKKV
ncbi:MAG TPA: hypothetical protein VIT91_00295 [Chthoniobacterales bacterium]